MLGLNFIMPKKIMSWFDYFCEIIYLKMTKWLPTNEKNSLPSFATAYLGAGGAVIDEENSEILLLTDRYNPTQDGKDLWVILC